MKYTTAGNAGMIAKAASPHKYNEASADAGSTQLSGRGTGADAFVLVSITRRRSASNEGMSAGARVLSRDDENCRRRDDQWEIASSQATYRRSRKSTGRWAIAAKMYQAYLASGIGKSSPARNESARCWCRLTLRGRRSCNRHIRKTAFNGKNIRNASKASEAKSTKRPLAAISLAWSTQSIIFI